VNGDSKVDRTLAPGRNHLRGSIRWRATQGSSPLVAIVRQIRVGSSAYSGGDFGVYRYRVYADDGTSAHRPDLSSPVLTEMTLVVKSLVPVGTDGSRTRRIAGFSPAWTPVAGRLYHLVIENVSANPGSDYSSENTLGVLGGSYTQYQPAWPNTDLAFLGTPSSAALPFNDLPSNLPIIDLEYADGSHDGNGYMRIDESNSALIGGSSSAGERIIVSGGDRTVTSIHWRVSRQTGSGALTARLENGDGSLIEQGTLAGAPSISTSSPGADNTRKGDWVGYTFSTPRVLRNGQTYRIRLTAPSGTTYFVTAVGWRDSNDINSEYMRSRRFTDGLPQKSSNDGSTWSNYDSWATSSNYQMYFTTE
jgi:hypothetical protein